MMAKKTRKLSVSIRTALLALLLTVAYSGTAAAHSHRCQAGCMASLDGVTGWLHHVVDLVATSGLLG
jgi:hypothetical protein